MAWEVTCWIDTQNIREVAPNSPHPPRTARPPVFSHSGSSGAARWVGGIATARWLLGLLHRGHPRALQPTRPDKDDRQRLEDRPQRCPALLDQGNELPSVGAQPFQAPSQRWFQDLDRRLPTVRLHSDGAFGA